VIEVNDLDRRIWQDELDEFVPRRVFDIHTHIYRWAFNLDPNKDASAFGQMFVPQWTEATWELADACDAQLMPGRKVHRLAFPFPWPYPCDFAGSNAFLGQELAKDPSSAGLMLVHPGMTADEAEASIDRFGFLGFKPYRYYATSGDAVNCRIPEFMPEHLIEVAHRRKLIIMMHVSKRDAIADPENIADMLRLCDKFPGVRWILAHCARSYSAWAIDKAAPALRELPNVWYDVSSVCESDAMVALYNGIGADRVMYGSDDIPIGVLRGKYISFGRAWAFLSESNHRLNLSHCDGRMTFTRYEQLRAMHRASQRLGMTRVQNEALFHDTAVELIGSSPRRPSAVDQ
jgi:hypothetical protein